MSDEDPVVDASVSELLALKAAAVVPSNSEGFYSKCVIIISNHVALLIDMSGG